MWQLWKDLTYPQIVGKILELFISEDEIPPHDIQGITQRAFQNFNHPEVIPIQQIGETTFIAELFRGPTFAFKDLAMSVIGQLLEFFLSRKKKHVTIVVGTSGDTGSAAIECIRNSKWADIVVLYPKGRCSILQELQMTSVLDDNVHILAGGVVAKRLGLPIELVATVNANKVIHKALTEGVLEGTMPAIQTIAPAMDIQVPYNFERLLYLVSDGDHAKVKQCMKKLETTGRLLLDPDVLEKLQETFSTFTANDDQLCRTIKRCWDENGYMICPHTAAALTYHYQDPMSAAKKRVCLATASPEKFPEAVKRAGIDRELTQLKYLHSLRTHFEFLEAGNWERLLREKIQKITTLRSAS